MFFQRATAKTTDSWVSWSFQPWLTVCAMRKRAASIISTQRIKLSQNLSGLRRTTRADEWEFTRGCQLNCQPVWSKLNASSYCIMCWVCFLHLGLVEEAPIFDKWWQVFGDYVWSQIFNSGICYIQKGNRTKVSAVASKEEPTSRQGELQCRGEMMSTCCIPGVSYPPTQAARRLNVNVRLNVALFTRVPAVILDINKNK